MPTHMTLERLDLTGSVLGKTLPYQAVSHRVVVDKMDLRSCTPNLIDLIHVRIRLEGNLSPDLATVVGVFLVTVLVT